MNTPDLKHSSRAQLLTSLLAALLGLNSFQLAIAAETTAGSNIGLKLIAEGLNAPTVLVSIPDGSGRLLVADQSGVIHLLARDGELYVLVNEINSVAHTRGKVFKLVPQ